MPKHSKESIAYLAGIIDGEGTVTIRRGQLKDKARNKTYRGCVRVCNKNWKMMQWVQERWPATMLKPGNKILRLDWEGERATDILEQVRPYLIIKAELADIVIEFERMRQEEAKHAKGSRRYSDDYHEIAPVMVTVCREATKDQYRGW